MTEPDQPAEPTGASASDSPPSIRALLRRDAWALAGGAAATLAVVLGTHAAASGADVTTRQATVASIAAATLWVALACPILAAGGHGALSALLRGGVVADASGVALLVLWALGRRGGGEPVVTVVAAMEVYCTFVAMALAGVAAARVPRGAAGRHVGALIAVLLMTAALASPFWISGPAEALGRDARASIVADCVYLNPFYSVTSALVVQTGFLWHQSGLMYGLSRLFDYAPPAVPWYAATVLYGQIAGILAATHLVRRTPGELRHS